jgi:hypothetical protein
MPPLNLKLAEGRKDPSYTFHHIAGDQETLTANHDFIEEKAREFLGTGFVRIEKPKRLSALLLVTIKRAPGFSHFRAWLSKHDF